MPTDTLITTTELAEQLGLDAAGRRHLRGWVRRRLVTPARTRAVSPPWPASATSTWPGSPGTRRPSVRPRSKKRRPRSW